METIKGIITLKLKSEGISKAGKKWVRCEYHINGNKYSTFDKKLMDFKEDDFVEIELKQNGQYKDMVNMKIVDENVSKEELKGVEKTEEIIETSLVNTRFEARKFALEMTFTQSDTDKRLKEAEKIFNWLIEEEEEAEAEEEPDGLLQVE